MPSYLMINSYIQEIEKGKKSGRGVKVETYNPVEARDLPKHLANYVNVYV